jgi:hypothetical protein
MSQYARRCAQARTRSHVCHARWHSVYNYEEKMIQCDLDLQCLYIRYVCPSNKSCSKVNVRNSCRKVLSALAYNMYCKAVPVLLKWQPHHDGVLGRGGIAPRILDLSTRWKWMVSFTSRPLFSQGKSPCYPLDRRLGGSQSRSRRGGEEKNSQPLSGLQPTEFKVRYFVLWMTHLFQENNSLCVTL